MKTLLLDFSSTAADAKWGSVKRRINEKWNIVSHIWGEDKEAKIAVIFLFENIALSVSRLGYFWKEFMTNFQPKVAEYLVTVRAILEKVNI